MFTSRALLKKMFNSVALKSTAQYSSELGSGAGKGGGAGGTIREAGGAFGKREAGLEEKFFHDKEREQLAKLREHMKDEVTFHEDQIKRHQEALAKAKENLGTIEK